MNSPDKPFTLIKGNSEQVALANRIACIDRINYLSGIDIRQKSKEFLLVFELTIWQNWYRDELLNARINEQYCQRAAQVIKEMGSNPVDYKKAVVDIEQKVRTAYTLHESKLRSKNDMPKRKEWWKFWKKQGTQ